MRITKPIRAPEWQLSNPRILSFWGGLIACYSMFFDDLAAVMYRKIDTTLLSETFLTARRGAGEAVGSFPGSLRIVTESDTGRVLSPSFPQG